TFTYGQTPKATARVVRSDGVVATAGTVTFQEGSTVLSGALPVGSDGTVSFTLPWLPAGPHTLTAAYSGAPSFSTGAGGIGLQVTQAPLTVTADDKSKTYGASDPALTYTPSGTLYFGDTYAVISGVVLTTDTGAAATVGTHVITASGGTAAN